MSDYTRAERLSKHRAVLQWLEYRAQQERKEIAKLETEAAEYARRQKVAHRELRFVSPVTPDEGA
ncbi:hypothetical protein [Streptomyces mesophilus]|uniref:hypothetical protein n=1 Tax=Streptomyces mesophilus TaxID=1775132 RepID=UPI00331E2D2A